MNTFIREGLIKNKASSNALGLIQHLYNQRELSRILP